MNSKNETKLSFKSKMKRKIKKKKKKMKNKKAEEILFEGDVFGEVELKYGIKRTTSVVALSPTIILIINKFSYKSICQKVISDKKIFNFIKSIQKVNCNEYVDFLRNI